MNEEKAKFGSQEANTRAHGSDASNDSRGHRGANQQGFDRKDTEDSTGYKRDDRRPSGFRSRGFFKKPRTCPFAALDKEIDYKDTKLLQRFLTERGKIMPRRLSFVSAKRQRELAKAVKRARFLGLLPYIID